MRTNASRTLRRKERIFDSFSRNLEFVKKHPQIVFEPDISNCYICPICFEGFTKADLSNESPNPLTFEDVPPKSLGGKPVVLTCKKCNSTAGHQLDAHLLHILQNESFRQFDPNSNAKVAFTKDGRRMNGKVKIDQSGKWHLHMEPNQSNPGESDYILTQLTTRSTRIMDYEALANYKPNSVTLTLTVKEIGELRNAEVGMLRIAYLSAFAKFGYGFMINNNLCKIREQIQNPSQNILRHAFWLRYDFPDAYLGTSIIFQPQAMTSFLVVFKLKTASFDNNFGIILPGPSLPGMDVYDYINDILCFGDGTEMCHLLMQPFSNTNFVEEEKYAFASHRLWQNILGDSSAIPHRSSR